MFLKKTGFGNSSIQMLDTEQAFEYHSYIAQMSE